MPAGADDILEAEAVSFVEELDEEAAFSVVEVSLVLPDLVDLLDAVLFSLAGAGALPTFTSFEIWSIVDAETPALERSETFE